MIFAAVAPVFVIIALGFFLRKRRVLTEEADTSLLRICVHLLYPSLIFTTIVGNDLFNDPVNLWFPPLTGILFIVIGYLAAWGGARALRLPPGSREARTFIYVTAIYNYGYTALPVVESLFGTKTLGILFAHNLGVEIAFWIGAAVILAGREGSGKPVWRQALSTPVIAILASLLLNGVNADDYLPRWLFPAAAMLGASAIPLALLLTGATLADFSANLTLGRPTLLSTAMASGIRLILLPLTFLLLARWLPCSRELKQVLVVQAAMPCAMLPIVLTRLYRGDTAMAVRIVVATTVLALLTIPYWVSLGLRLVGIAD